MAALVILSTPYGPLPSEVCHDTQQYVREQGGEIVPVSASELITIRYQFDK